MTAVPIGDFIIGMTDRTDSKGECFIEKFFHLFRFNAEANLAGGFKNPLPAEGALLFLEPGDLRFFVKRVELREVVNHQV